jgi:uncharacterized lipoprotein YddW (UPF0748 family)
MVTLLVEGPSPMRIAVLFAVGSLTLLASAFAADAPPPAVLREFRGAWVATVGNIDWPSKKGLTRWQQEGELTGILNACAELKLNAVILQVRPMADALYKSDLEPWSEFLTGTAGKDPGYDPLEFAVREAHARGIELHAWVNPYRAWVPAAKSPVPPNHVIKTRPDLVKRIGQYYWLNPTNKDVREHSLAVIRDIVRRYDIDGIHMDDYFYPYPDYSGGMPFPDDDTWAAYQTAGGTLSRDDWRRAAVNSFVERLYKETKAAKPWVKVGISPFGIWRPGHPDGIKGFDQYDKLYADAKLWLNKGWVDYLTPQLYWPIGKKEQSFPKLLDWWIGENTQHRFVWPGLATYRLPGAEIANQIKLTRERPGQPGHVHFSMRTITKGMTQAKGLVEALMKLYAEPALVPAMPWLGGVPPAKPSAELDRIEGVGYELKLKPGGDGARKYVVQWLEGGKWSTSIYSMNSSGCVARTRPDRVRVTAVSRLGLVSDAVELGK